MSTLLPIDAATSPRSIVIDPPMTDAQFEEFCRINHSAHIERTREGVIRMNPLAGSFSSDGNAEIGTQLRLWWRSHRSGRTYDSSAGFYLPDGSLLSPDAAYITAKKLKTLTLESREGFPRICPDFVIELLSKSDRLSDAMDKWRVGSRVGRSSHGLSIPTNKECLFMDRAGLAAGLSLPIRFAARVPWRVSRSISRRYGIATADDPELQARTATGPV